MGRAPRRIAARMLSCKAMTTFDDLPLLGICGWSGAGKTTLLEQILRHFAGRGLRIAIVKHDVHGIEVDRPGKDSDRLFRAGADVLLQGPGEGFLRVHRTTTDWVLPLTFLAERYDLVLVEGHKDMPMRKVWLLSDGETEPPAGAQRVAAVLPRDGERLAAIVPILEAILAQPHGKSLAAP